MQWDRPDGYKMKASDAKVAAAFLIQCWARTALARKRLLEQVCAGQMTVASKRPSFVQSFCAASARIRERRGSAFGCAIEASRVRPSIRTRRAPTLAETTDGDGPTARLE